MKRAPSVLAAFTALVALSGCATTQEAYLSWGATSKNVATAALTPSAGNSPEMDEILTAALRAEGITVKAPLPQGAQKSPDVDAVVGYTDIWRWDIVMYLKSISILMYDPETGDLMVVGHWKDSPMMHGYHDPKIIVQGLLSEMMAKLRAGGHSAAGADGSTLAVPGVPGALGHLSVRRP